MILHDVMKQLTLTDLDSILACMFERGIKVDFCKEHGHEAVFGFYMDFAQRLCRLTPTRFPEGEEMVLLGYPQKGDPEDENDEPRPYVNVTLYKQAQLRELDPKALVPNAFLVGPDLAVEQIPERLAKLREEPCEWERFAFDNAPWEETLGCEVSWDNICRCGLHAFMAEVLHEMINGFDREVQDEHRKTIAERIAASLIAAMRREGKTDEEIARAVEAGELPDLRSLDGQELEELRRALHGDDSPEEDEEDDEAEDDGEDAEEEGGDSAPDLRSLVDMLSSLAKREGAKDVVLPAALVSGYFPEIEAEDGGERKDFYTLEDIVAMAAKRGIDIDLEAMERERKEKETPAFIIAKTRVMLWNAAQERRALLDWLGASPVIAEMREEGED